MGFDLLPVARTSAQQLHPHAPKTYKVDLRLLMWNVFSQYRTKDHHLFVLNHLFGCPEADAVCKHTPGLHKQVQHFAKHCRDQGCAELQMFQIMPDMGNICVLGSTRGLGVVP